MSPSFGNYNTFINGIIGHRSQVTGHRSVKWSTKYMYQQINITYVPETSVVKLPIHKYYLHLSVNLVHVLFLLKTYCVHCERELTPIHFVDKTPVRVVHSSAPIRYAFRFVYIYLQEIVSVHWSHCHPAVDRLWIKTICISKYSQSS